MNSFLDDLTLEQLDGDALDLAELIGIDAVSYTHLPDIPSLFPLSFPNLFFVFWPQQCSLPGWQFAFSLSLIELSLIHISILIPNSLRR